jgi:hypothetical protein
VVTASQFEQALWRHSIISPLTKLKVLGTELDREKSPVVIVKRVADNEFDGQLV